MRLAARQRSIITAFVPTTMAGIATGAMWIRTRRLLASLQEWTQIATDYYAPFKVLFPPLI